MVRSFLSHLTLLALLKVLYSSEESDWSPGSLVGLEPLRCVKPGGEPGFEDPCMYSVYPELRCRDLSLWMDLDFSIHVILLVIFEIPLEV